MKLFTKAQETKLSANAEKKDGFAYVKLFNPAGIGTWYLSELYPNGLAYGLAHIHEKEFGLVDINELKSLELPFGLSIERDKWFDPTPLEDCKNL